ncbi:speriolin [Indicator indicator]|uniref:speriolin n=1 Tax=Indicator indicator TaxID=1002788 RepID=UPI0023DF37B1|nr:speriolin [Indicator indicator]
MEPLGGRAAVVLAYYNQLRLEIQALVAENQELIQAVRLLRGQQRAARTPMVTPPVASASERQFFPNAAPVNAWRLVPDQGVVFQHPSREQHGEQGVWNRVLLPSVGGDFGGGMLGNVSGQPLIQTTSNLGSLSAGPIPLAGGSLGSISGVPLALAGGGIGGISGVPVAQGGGSSSIGTISGGPIPQGGGSFGSTSGGPIALGSGTLGTISSEPLLQGSGSTLSSIGGGPIVQGGGSFGSSIIGGPILQGGSSIGGISGISAGPVAQSTGPVALGSGSFGSSGGSIIGGPTVQGGGSVGSISGISAGPVAQSTAMTAQGSGTLGTISSQPLPQSGSTLGSGGPTAQGSGGIGTASTGPVPQGSGSIGTITGGPITQGSGSRSFLAVPSPSGSPPLTSHSFSSTGGSPPQVPPQDNPEPPQDVPVSPRDVPVSPHDVPVSPRDVPADVPVSPRDVPVSPRDVPMPPQDVPMSPQDGSVPAPNVSASGPMMPEMSSFGLQVSDLQVSSARASRDASRVLSGLDQPQTSTPGGAQQQIWEQLVGEVAFQLDRRILARVFPDRPRVYGFTVSNIPEKIAAVSLAQGEQLGTVLATLRISLGAVPEAVAEQWASAAICRYLGLMRQLRVLGYSPSVHPAFAESLVNTYGILADRSFPNHDLSFLRQVIIDTVPVEAQEKALLLLHCLDMLARDDGQPLFC